jgi:transposase InsO family protein
MHTALTITTLEQAVLRQPPLAGLIHHSDRGSQYAAIAFQERLGAWHATPSMSRKGNPYDTALAESFVATLKPECFGCSIPSTKAAARLMVFDYIETFYNRRRRHSSLGYRSPLDFEKQMFPPNKNN